MVPVWHKPRPSRELNTSSLIITYVVFCTIFGVPCSSYSMMYPKKPILIVKAPPPYSRVLGFGA